MNTAIKQTLYSADEYLALERKAAYKSEFCRGQIYAMTGASRQHNLISINICRELSTQLKKSPCETYSNDMRVKASGAHSYHYPDIAVVCGTPQFEDLHADTLLNPSLLIEILSPSTEAYDRGGKFSHYRKIPTLCEYLLVAQDQPCIERYVRQGEFWLLMEISGLDATAHLECIHCDLSLREVYDKVLCATEF